MHSDVIGCPFQSRVKKWMCVIYQRVCPLKLMENTNLKPWTLKFLYISFILFLCTNPITLHHSPLTLLFSFGGFLGFFFRYLFLLVLFPGITDRSVIACLLSPPAFEDSQCLCPLPACCISPVPHKFTNGPDNQLQEDPRIKFLGDSWLGNIPLSSWFWPHSELSCPCCCGHCGCFRWGEEPGQGFFVPLCFFPLQLLILCPELHGKWVMLRDRLIRFYRAN